MTAHPYIALVGKKFALVWAAGESAPFEIEGGAA